MRAFRALRNHCRLELAIVVVPLIAILVLQYVSSRRLAEVEVFAHQTAIAQYLDAVRGDVQGITKSGSGHAECFRRMPWREGFYEVVGLSQTAKSQLGFCLPRRWMLSVLTGARSETGRDPHRRRRRPRSVVLSASPLLYCGICRWIDQTLRGEADRDHRVVPL